MGLREKVEEQLSIEDVVSIEEMKDIAGCTISPCVTRVRRMARLLLAFLETPDPEDDELDDLRMRVAIAEVEQDKAEKAQAAARDMIRHWADSLSTVKGDVPAKQAENLVAAMRKFVE